MIFSGCFEPRVVIVLSFNQVKTVAYIKYFEASVVITLSFEEQKASSYFHECSYMVVFYFGSQILDLRYSILPHHS